MVHIYKNSSAKLKEKPRKGLRLIPTINAKLSDLLSAAQAWPYNVRSSFAAKGYAINYDGIAPIQN